MYVILSGTICGNFVFTEQLNHAARHRNVYYDMVGGDPYGEKDYCYLTHYLYSFVKLTALFHTYVLCHYVIKSR